MYDFAGTMCCVQRGAQMANGSLVLIEKVLKNTVKILLNSGSCMHLHTYPEHCKHGKDY
jgi:hypothetical protein